MARTAADTIVLGIRLESGKFEMQLKHPIFADTTEADFRESIIDAWLALLMQALRSGVASMDAVLKDQQESPK